MAIISVFLDRVTNLTDKDLIGKSDPYVKLELIQDNLVFDKKFGSVTSSKKADNLNPIYGESFSFEIPSTMGLHNMVLICKVMDDDFLMDQKLGQCKIKLDDLPLSATPIGVERVVDDNWFTKDARIFLTIAYNP